MKKIVNSLLMRLHPLANYLFKYQLKLSILLLLIAIVIAYLNYPSLDGENIYRDMPQSLGAVLNTFVDPGDALKNLPLFIAQFIAFLAFSIVVLAGLFRDSVTKNLYKVIGQSRHTLVIGLGENNRVYLDSECQRETSSRIIIIEPNANNPHLDTYREKGFGIFLGTIEDYQVNFPTLEHVIISAGDDRLNIDIVGELKSKLDAANLNKNSFGCKTTVHIHLSNQSYKTIFYEQLLTPAKEELRSKLEYKTFSYEDTAARSLFMRDTVLGNQVEELIRKPDEFSVIVIGNGILAERVIYHLVMMASLPYGNKLNLYLYSQDSMAFLEKLRMVFYGFDKKLSGIEVHPVNVNFDTPECWCKALWSEPDIKNLTQLYICHDEESLNLQTAINIHEYVYLNVKRSEDKEWFAKVNFAMYHNLALSQVIKNDKKDFSHFYSFGDAQEIFCYEALIEEPHEKVAKLIHHGYGEKLVDSDSAQPSKKDLENKWLDSTKFSDRESSRSQALHMHTKLKALGINLDYKNKKYAFPGSETGKSFRDYLLGNNKGEPCFGLNFDKPTLLNSFEILGWLVHQSYRGVAADPKVIDYIFNLLVREDFLLSRLVLSEHERWNRFHILNGWLEVSEGAKDKSLKFHDCLKPLNSFVNTDKRMTVLYDLYSVLYLDLYLKSIELEVEKIIKNTDKVDDVFKNLHMRILSVLYLCSFSFDKICEKKEPKVKEISIGVTGKRELNKQEDTVKRQIIADLNKLFINEKYKDIDEIKITLVSPLAEGADRVFVEAIKELSTENKKIKIDRFKLWMPFEKEKYKDGFGAFNGKTKEELQIEFDDMAKAETYGLKPDHFMEEIVENLPDYISQPENMDPLILETDLLTRSNYFLVGSAVVNNSDVLFAIRDPGEEYQSDNGGTESIVKYFNDQNSKLPENKKKTLFSINL